MAERNKGLVRTSSAELHSPRDSLVISIRPYPARTVNPLPEADLRAVRSGLLGRSRIVGAGVLIAVLGCAVTR